MWPGRDIWRAVSVEEVTTAPVLIAHRGFSSRHPEMTRAAYQAAVEWAQETEIPLGLECDVHFSADDELICLHDLTLDRTSTSSGPAYQRTVAELKLLDFGSRWVADPAPEQRELITLRELMIMVRDARDDHVPVGMVIETKHPNDRGRAVEERVAAMLIEFGWDQPDAPVRLLSFSVKALRRFGWLLPGMERTLLIEDDLGRWRDGRLPDGVRIVGPDLALIKEDPGFVERSLQRGHEVHVWTVNEPEDIRFCRDLGVTGFTTDYPDRVAAVLEESLR
jgi:glycerophosphoryl diester phosphodiesterase